jgi:putative DNA-invertase from lambdoid prophage Rac
LLAIFAEFEREILRERVKAGIAHARNKGKEHGRPATAKKRTDEIVRIFNGGLSQSEIARKLGIGRTSVRRILNGFTIG